MTPDPQTHAARLRDMDPNTHAARMMYAHAVRDDHDAFAGKPEPERSGWTTAAEIGFLILGIIVVFGIGRHWHG